MRDDEVAEGKLRFSVEKSGVNRRKKATTCGSGDNAGGSKEARTPDLIHVKDAL